MQELNIQNLHYNKNTYYPKEAETNYDVNLNHSTQGNMIFI